MNAQAPISGRVVSVVLRPRCAVHVFSSFPHRGGNGLLFRFLGPSVHVFALVRRGEEFEICIMPEGHVRKVPAESAPLLDHEIHVVGRPDRLGVVPVIAGRKAKWDAMGFEHVHGMDDLAVRALAPPEIRLLLESLDAEGKRKVSQTAGCLRKALIDQGSLENARNSSLMRSAGGVIVFADERFAAC